MDATPQAENEQMKIWNGPSGRAWVEMQELLDRVLKPFEDLLVEGASAGLAGRASGVSPATDSKLARATTPGVGQSTGSTTLDVGCGTGSTTLAIARRLGAKGRCIGIDISEPMIALARARAEREGTPATFILANAQTHAFETAGFDMIVSRFGVMFFDDPVSAFANLRHAARPGAGLRFIAWRSPAENPFMTTAERAAAPLLPNLPPRQPDAPGQFAFADGRRVHRILEESGWAGIDIRPVDVPCTLQKKELERYVTRLGPVGATLQEADEQTRAKVIETVLAAFDPYVHGSDVRFTAACWMVDARA